MAHLNLDARIINNFANDDIALELNSIIDNELSKNEEDINTNLVEECINALFEIEKSNNNAILVPLISSDEYLSYIHSALNLTKNHRLSRPMRVAMIAAIIASGTFTANAAVGAITGYNIIERVSDAIKGAFSDDEFVDEGDNATANSPVTNDYINNDVENSVDTTGNTSIEYIDYNSITNDEAITSTTAIATTKEDNIVDEESTTTPATTTAQQTTELDATTTTEPTTFIDGVITLPDINVDGDETSKQPTSQTADVTPSSPTDINRPVKRELVNLYYNTDNFKTNYIYGERLDYSGLELTALFSDGTSEELTVEDCDFYTNAVDMNVTADHTLTILYKNASIKLYITVRPDEETRYSSICSNDSFIYLKNSNGAYVIKYLGSYNDVSIDYIDDVPIYAISPKIFKDTGVKAFSSNNLKKIYPSAFEGCCDMFYFYAPNVEYIGDNAFNGCKRLDELTIGNLDYIGGSAFKNSGLKKLTIPSKITSIPDRLCEGCTNLTKVTLEGAVDSVGDYAFSECESLEYVAGAGNITSVGKFGFYADENVEFDEFNPNFKSAGEAAFYACRNIKMGELNHLEIIGAGAFERCAGLTGVTLPNDITAIPPNAFKTTNIKKIVIPSSVKSIGEYAFMSTKLTELNIPNSVEVIGTYAFYTVTLRNIYLPESLTTIGSNAFYNGSRVKIYAPAESYAHDYAINNEFNYVQKD